MNEPNLTPGTQGPPPRPRTPATPDTGDPTAPSGTAKPTAPTSTAKPAIAHPLPGTATQGRPAGPANGTGLLEARGVSKYFGSVNALQDISLSVNAGEVTCVLGDNGAGKSTLIKILSGVHIPDEGTLLIDGTEVTFTNPREARAQGIATVFQDLATVPLMSVWRNFFLGNEPSRGWGPLQRLDIKQAQKIMREELGKMGIDLRDPDQTVGTLSGG
ncbi:MAG: ATP-binding cassette domain-containing protein, partial [Chloroflexota bacterium]|nr:ATP-binding cassette domain-containing protein [Chloroflexota bacterium]